MFLLRSEGMPQVDRHMFAAVARVVLRGDLGGLAPQLDRPTPWLYPVGDALPSVELRSPPPASQPVEVPPLLLENGTGGFTADGREYVVVLDGDRETPLPWSNVIANADVWNHGQRLGLRVHVGGEQPRESADAVCERSRLPIRRVRRSFCATAIPARCGVPRRDPCPAGPMADAGWFATRPASRAINTRSKD